jgi:ribosomal protein L32
MYGSWLSKQSSGTCTTWHYLVRQAKTLARKLENKCSNCGKVETSNHLNQCPSKYQRKLLKEGVEALEEWMHKDGQTNPQVTYWVHIYVILQGHQTMTSLGPMFASMEQAVASQDMIG